MTNTQDELQRAEPEAVKYLRLRLADESGYINTPDIEAIHEILSGRAELLAAVERMRDGLKKIELLPLRLLSLDPMDDFTKGAQAARLNAADIARTALTTGEDK